MSDSQGLTNQSGLEGAIGIPPSARPQPPPPAILPGAAPAAIKLALVSVLVLATDGLLYSGVSEVPSGWPVGALATVVVLAMAIANRLLASRAGVITFVATATACASLINQPTTLGLTLALVGILSFALAAQPDWLRDVLVWLRGLGAFLDDALASTARAFRDGWHAAKPGGLLAQVSATAWLWAMPLAFAAVFLVLLSDANPVLAWLVDQTAGKAWDWLGALVQPGRIVLWIAATAVAFVLVHRRLLRLPAPSETPNGPGIAAGLDSAWPEAGVVRAKLFAPAAVVRALATFNLLFALHNGLDMAVLWGGQALPAGITYAKYAHKSAYPLVLTALLAGAFVLATVGAGSRSGASRTVRVLLYAWIAQNIVLVLSAIARTWLYVEYYSLTYLRVAAFVWMGLVAVGLVLLIVRLATNRSNGWLLNANVVVLLVTLLTASFVNFGGLIADYNVDHCGERGGNAVGLDVGYLHDAIGLEALPALRRFVAAVPPEASPIDPKVWPRGTAARRAALAIAVLDIEAQGRSRDWRKWTLRQSGGIASLLQ